jgi:hypothetical protein
MKKGSVCVYFSNVAGCRSIAVRAHATLRQGMAGIFITVLILLCSVLRVCGMCHYNCGQKNIP